MLSASPNGAGDRPRTSHVSAITTTYADGSAQRAVAITAQPLASRRSATTLRRAAHAKPPPAKVKTGPEYGNKRPGAAPTPARLPSSGDSSASGGAARERAKGMTRRAILFISSGGSEPDVLVGTATINPGARPARRHPNWGPPRE